MPQQLVILSGKGGTGKTTIAASFFAMSEATVAADCDVDAPNLHLLLAPRIVSQEPFDGSMTGMIDQDACVHCDACAEACAFGAIRGGEVDPRTCEGCGVCELLCLVGAAKLVPRQTGLIYQSETQFGPLAHALLVPGSDATGKLVTAVKLKALNLARERELPLMIVDGSPGTGCPVIASIAGARLVLAVAEPTVSGFWGLQRIAAVAKHFGAPLSVCVNKADINPEITERIRDYVRTQGGEWAGLIPFDEEVNAATMRGQVLTETSQGPAAVAIRQLWEDTVGRLQLDEIREARR